MAWLGTWANRIEIDLDNTNVDSDLTHFPVLIKLGHNVGQNGQDTGVVFDKLTTNSLKLAVTDEDGTTQLYVEIEKWDNTVPEACLWVSSSTFVLHAARPTKIYLYFDASQDDNTTYVGVTNSVVAESVWDANFLMIQHMADGASNATTYDSTDQDNDGAKLGANEPIEATGKIGEGQLYDNNDDFIETAAPVIPTTDFTISALVNTDDFATYQAIIGQIDAVEAGRLQFLIEQTTGKLYLQITTAEVSDTGITAAIWQAVDITRVGSAVTFYNHGAPDGTATLADNVSQDDVLEIGRATANRMLGSIDEVRISDVGRSAAFIKVQKETAWDNLCTFNFCGDWLQSWKHRIAITIDSSKVDSDLTHFPVMIRISAKTGQSEQDLTRVFDEVGVEDQKIAVTDDTGTQQLYVEVEKWDSTNEEAILWVSRIGWEISSTEDTIIYLYYDADMDDNTYFVDVPNSTPGERVWDEYFALVDHMADGVDNAHTRDSTSYDNDGTKKGANEPIEATGKIGEAQDFDGGDDFIDCGNDASVQMRDALTVEALINRDGVDTSHFIVTKDNGVQRNWSFHVNSSNQLEFFMWVSNALKSSQHQTLLGAATCYYSAVVYDKTDIRLYLDAVVDTSPLAETGQIDNDAVNLYIGQSASGVGEFEGPIDEVRVSNIARTAAWLKATYNACFDTLLTYAIETAKWKPGWEKRIKITVSKDNIDEALEWFPLMIRISGSCGASAQDMTRVFDELGVEDLKIAITEADGVTDLYVEVEKWDSNGEEAILWVARDGFFFSSVVDTVLYLYFDADHADNSTYVGVPRSAPGEVVWDANFLMVQHMNDNPDVSNVRDSTSNDNDGAKRAANEPIETDGKIGKGQAFDGTDDYISCGNDASLHATVAVTLEMILQRDWTVAPPPGTKYAVLKQVGADGILFRQAQNYTFRFFLADGVGQHNLDTTTVINTGSDPYAIACTYDGDKQRIYISGALDKEGSADPFVIDMSAGNFLIGRPVATTWDGYEDEIRLSDIARSTAWLKATKETMWDNVVTFTIEGETIPVVLVDIAWIGDAMADSPDWYAVDSAGGSDNQGCTRYHFKKGRQHALARMATGQLDLVLKNLSGYYWPDKRNGPWYPYVISGAKIRVRCVYDGTLYPRFMGFIDEWLPDWLGGAGIGPVMTLTATDGMEHLANTVINDGGEASELTGTRVGNILDTAGWPAADRDIATGNETLQGTGAQADVNALNHIQLVNESELGIIFVAFGGDMVWQDRSTRSNSPYNTIQSIFGDDLSEMPYVNLKASVDRDLLFNEFRRTIIGGAEQSEGDGTSQNRYGKRTNAKSGLLNLADIQADVLCEYLVKRYKDAATIRVKKLELLPRSEASSLFPKAFLYDISTRITCRQNDSKLDRDYFIEGVEESAEAKTINWRTSWQLSDVLTELPPLDARGLDILPDGAGDETNINFKTEATNWQSVINSGTGSYVENSDNEITFDRDLYELAAPAYTQGTINKITVEGHFLADPNPKTAPGAVKLAISSNGTVAESGQTVVSIIGYETVTYDWATDPDTAAAWTWAAIAALQAGPSIKRALPFMGSVNWTRCKYLKVTINFTPTWA